MMTWLRAAGVAVACFAAALVSAQDAVRPQDVNIRVTDMKVDAVKYSDKYPDVKGVPAGGRRDYAMIAVDYTVQIANDSRQRKNPGGMYVDQIVFEWSVVVSDETRIGRINAREIVRLTKTVTYEDLRVESSKDRDKVAVIYVGPRVLERFASKYKDENVFYMLTVKVGGKTVETAWGQGDQWTRSNSDRNKYIPRNSGGDDLFSSEDVAERQGGLLNRHETPWLYYSEDNVYETIKAEETGRR